MADTWLDEIHKRGGDCDKERDKIWGAIRNVEADVVAEKIETIKLSTRIAVTAGLLCGIPGFILVCLEIFRTMKGLK